MTKTLEDRTILDHSVRHLVHSMGMSAQEYGQALKQGLWASPMDLSLLAEYYDLTCALHLEATTYMIGNHLGQHHLLLKDGHYLLVKPRRTTRTQSSYRCPMSRGGGRGQARGQAKARPKPAPKRQIPNQYARPGVQVQRRYRLRSPPRSPSLQPAPVSPPAQPIDLEQQQQQEPMSPARTVSPTMTFSTQIERERQHQMEQQEGCR